MRQLKKKLRLAIRLGSARRLGFDRDAKIVRTYLDAGGTKKLQIGCGRRILSGWLNADFYPKTRDVLHLDATRPLPFPDNAFTYVFSEHMIEHVPFAEGRGLVEECFRVLEPGGTARLSTPDLAFLIDLYRPEEPPERERTPLQEAFLDHFLDTEIKRRDRHAPWNADTFLINKFVRAWGHEFIYDEKTLTRTMEEAGFTSVVRCEVMKSAHPELRELEHVERKPEGHLGLESMVLEATKPAHAEAGR